MKCPQCGKEIQEDAKFCPSCKTAIGSRDTHETWGGAATAAASSVAADDVTNIAFTRSPVVGSDVLTPPPGFAQTPPPSSSKSGPASSNEAATWMGGPNTPTFGVPSNSAPSAPDTPTNAGWSSAGAAAAPALAAHVDFGRRYKVERLLGQGGMGAVYLAYDQELGRPVALKLVKPELAVHPEAMARFRQELLLASKISHRNILRIHDLGDADGMKFISMAYVDGEDLHHLLMREGKLPVERMLHITRQLCSALDAAHAEGVVHRDLKPQNIMLGPNDHVYVSDFGLAKSLGAVSSMTQSGEMLGTPRYMAPEQVEAKQVDARTDIFSLGLIFYEMVTGDVPFTAETTLQLMYKRAHETPPAPKTIVPDLPDWLNNVIMKCLERDPANRYQSAHEILADIDSQRKPDLAPEMRTVILPASPVPVKSFPRRWFAVAAGAVGIAIALLGVPQIRHFIFRGSAATEMFNGKPVTVLVGDFTNHTGDPLLNGTLEPMVNVALERATFVNAFNRGSARKLAQKLPNPTDKLDEQPARLVAVSQGVGAVITGEISRRGDNYKLSLEALDSRTGNTIGSAEVTVTDKNQLVNAVPKLVAPIRQALGDKTPESAQLADAGGAFTAASLEAVHEYGVAMEQQFAGNIQGALKAFSQAVELDPNFARGYAGIAGMSANLGKQQDADKYIKLAMEHVDRMTDRERLRIRGLYYGSTGNWQKCIEEYSELVNKYPADNIGHNNLANCYSHIRNLPKAVEEVRRAVEINPNSVTWRANLALFSNYAGDSQSGAQEAAQLQKANPSFEYGYLAQAFSQLLQGESARARETFEKLAKVSPLGASIAASGLADVAVYEGRFSEAVGILEKGVEADLVNKNSDAAADKYASVANAHLAMQQKPAAIAAAEKALSLSKTVKIRFLAAEVFVEAGEAAKAQKLASELAAELDAEPQAYAKVIAGSTALKRGDARAAVKAFTEANGLLDTWIGHFELGRAYVAAGAFAEADSEFDRCLKRRGEALALFLDEAPTYGYFPPVYYYQGVVRQGLKSPGFADSFGNYSVIRGKSNDDVLMSDIRKRTADLK